MTLSLYWNEAPYLSLLVVIALEVPLGSDHLHLLQFLVQLHDWRLRPEEDSLFLRQPIM
jgi:hypothetical protein